MHARSGHRSGAGAAVEPAAPAVTLDPWHAAVVDLVMASDAARVAAGEMRFVSLIEPHELCLPSGCASWGANLVEVIAIADGLRIRRPLAAAEGAA